MERRKRYSRKFQRMAVERMRTCESVDELAKELIGLANGGRNISRSLKMLCLKRNIGNLSAIQEKSGYFLRQRETSGLSARTEGIAHSQPAE